MIPKRIFWLTCAAAVSWLIWMRLRQRQAEFTHSTPHFAPPHTLVPAAAPTPAATPAHPPAQAEPANQALPVVPRATDQPLANAISADGAADIVDADDAAESDISGYCMRCKTKRQIHNAHRETTESGRPAARGTCPVCGANMFTFLATNEAYDGE